MEAKKINNDGTVDARTKAAPEKKAGEYHVIGLAYGRTELQRGNKHVADLTTSPAIADAICNILAERATLLSALKMFAYNYAPGAPEMSKCRAAAHAAIDFAEGGEK